MPSDITPASSLMTPSAQPEGTAASQPTITSATALPPFTTPPGFGPDEKTTTLEDLRRRAKFNVFVPTYLPGGILVEKPIFVERLGTSLIVRVSLIFRTRSGEAVLRIDQAPDVIPGEGSIMEVLNQATLNMPIIEIDGRKIHACYDSPRGTGIPCWWIQDGTYINMQVSQLAKEEHIRVMRSLSATASLP